MTAKSMKEVPDVDFAEYCVSPLDELRGIALAKGLTQLSMSLAICAFEAEYVAKRIR